MKKEVGVKNIEVNHRSTLKVLATTCSIATMIVTMLATLAT